MKKYALVAFGAMLFASVALTQAAEQAVKMLADFNSPAPNNVQGNFGGFTPNPEEQVYVCTENIDSAVKHEGSSSLRLDYNVGNGGAYNGFWMKLGATDDATLDGSAYTKLTFWVKGDEKAGIPSKFKVELKSGKKKGDYYVGEVTGEWKKIEIPMDTFAKKGGVDLSKLSEMTIVFEQKYANPGTQGSLYIDEIALEK